MSLRFEVWEEVSREAVTPGFGSKSTIERLVVPGGWIYRHTYYGYDDPLMSTCFVPTPEASK